MFCLVLIKDVKTSRDVCDWYNSGFQHPTGCNSIVSFNGTPSPSCRIIAVYFWNATRDCDQPASVCGFALLIGARCDAQTPGLCGAVQEGPGQVGSAAQHHHRHDSQHTLTGTHNSLCRFTQPDNTQLDVCVHAH